MMGSNVSRVENHCFRSQRKFLYILIAYNLYTVRNAAGFPGDQTVGLPTLVQNPLTANDTVNPTGLGSRLILFGLPVSNR